MLVLSSCQLPAGCNIAGREIRMDGSSTVYPLSEALAEDYHVLFPDSHLLIGISGTTGGFIKFTAGLIPVTAASRPILAAENAVCIKNSIGYLEIPLCFDQVVVLVNKSNFWVDHLTMDELHLMWAPTSQGRILFWDQVRAGWPHRPIHLYSPGPASGTFQYFTELVNGKASLSREDVNPSHDPGMLINNLISDPVGLAYFGYIYYQKSRNSLKRIPIQDTPGLTRASASGLHPFQARPLSRMLFLYVNLQALKEKEFRRFLSFYLANLEASVKETGYIPFSEDVYSLIRQNSQAGQVLSLLTADRKPRICTEQELITFLHLYKSTTGNPHEKN